MKRYSRPLHHDVYVGKMTVEDDRYVSKVRDILLAEPCRGMPSEPSQLLGHIYIGSQTNAESLKLLRRLGITHVLNCAGFKGPRKHPEVSPYEGLGIEYYEFKADDNDTYDITRHFPEAFAFLAKVERTGGVCLIHCAMGINRSGATCAAYMMHHKNWPLMKVIRTLKDKRRVVLTNHGFRWQLVRFARSKNLLEKLEDEPKRIEDLKPPVDRWNGWYTEEIEYVPARNPRAWEKIELIDDPVSNWKEPRPDYKEGVSQMDLLSRSINEALAKESGRSRSRPRSQTRSSRSMSRQ